MEIFGTCVQGEVEHSPEWGRNSPFPCHHLAGEKFTWSAAAGPCAEHGSAGWALLLLWAQGPAWGRCQQRPEEGRDAAGGYNMEITFGLCTERGKRVVKPPQPCWCSERCLACAGKESDWGVQQACARDGKTRPGKRESLKLLWGRWTTNHLLLGWL